MIAIELPLVRSIYSSKVVDVLLRRDTDLNALHHAVASAVPLIAAGSVHAFERPVDRVRCKIVVNRIDSLFNEATVACSSLPSDPAKAIVSDLVADEFRLRS